MLPDALNPNDSSLFANHSIQLMQNDAVLQQNRSSLLIQLTII